MWQPQLHLPSIVSNIYCPMTFPTTLSIPRLGLLPIELLETDYNWSGGSLLTATSTSSTHSQSCSASLTYLWPLSFGTQSLAIAYWSFPGCRASHGNLFVSLGRGAKSQHFNLKPTFSIKPYHLDTKLSVPQRRARKRTALCLVKIGIEGLSAENS